ncbi:MAG: ABC transporter permease subunit [Verrucomicrobiaceae bacterium]|nr:ABC transporter permease subunit [Verrucomicrobiaceae bacterium]
MTCSFLLPLALWCLIAYLPVWKSEIRISLSSDANNSDFPTVYVPGDHMEEARFDAFRAAVRQDNTDPQAAETAAAGRRANKRILRGITPLALAENWITPEQEKDYAALYTVWQRIALGELSGGLSQENLGIVSENWADMSAVSPSYNSRNFPSEPLLKLIPEGKSEVKRPVFLPAPHEIIARASEDFRGQSELGDLNVWGRYLVSIRTIAGGFLLVCLVGVPIALLCGTFSFFSRLIEPCVDFFRYMPAPAFGTLLIALFGIYDAPKLALVFLGTLPQLILMVANTTRMLDTSLLDAAQTLGANRKQLVTRVVIPGILPNLHNDIRILLGWAWTWLIIAELLGVKAGLTEIIDTQGRRFHFDHVYPIILLIGLTGFLTDQFLAWFRGVIFPYTEQGISASARSAARVLSKVSPLRLKRALRAKPVTVAT